MPSRSAPWRGAQLAPAAGFDFTLHLRRLCADLVARLPELAHIDLDRVALGFTQARRPGRFGVQATLTPLRFQEGATTTLRRGRLYRMTPVLDGAGRHMLYLLRVALPRFFDNPPEERLRTVIHELWHISPKFDGDLRRFAGRCYAHGRSQKHYESEVEVIAARWRAIEPRPAAGDFLEKTFAELLREHGRVYGLRIPSPRLIPVDA